MTMATGFTYLLLSISNLPIDNVVYTYYASDGKFVLLE